MNFYDKVEELLEAIDTMDEPDLEYMFKVTRLHVEDPIRCYDYATRYTKKRFLKEITDLIRDPDPRSKNYILNYGFPIYKIIQKHFYDSKHRQEDPTNRVEA